MKIFNYFPIIFLAMALVACGPFLKVQQSHSDLLENLMKQHPDQFDEILKNRDAFRVQIIYTQIDRAKNNTPIFTDYYFNVDASKYFYPASTVKLPTALLALEKLNQLQSLGVNRRSSLITEAAFSKQTPVYNDPTSPDGRPTIEQYIKKIFLVSDNDAFNRLYEMLGQEYLNDRLHKKGYKQVDILHHLNIYMTEEENRHTNPVKFFDDSTRLLIEQPMQYNKGPYPARKDSVGKAYYSGNTFVQHPMNFSSKNRLPLQDLHAIMRSVMFPESVKRKQRFQLNPEQYRFVRQYLSQYPAETNFPQYDTASYWDAYGKFLYWGGQKGSLPKTFRSFSKEGDAYGFLIDAAYIVDFERKIEFLLSAVIYCNKDEILNDDHYDFDSLGLPFMKNIGRLLYDYELKRQRAYQPDLSTFRLDYKN